MTFETVINRIQPKLRGIAHNLNGNFTFFDDDDLYQEALIHLWISWQECGFDGKNDSYILQGCYFHLKNYLRKTLDRVSLIRIDANESDDQPLEESGLLGSVLMDHNGLDTRLIDDKMAASGLTSREKEIVSLFLDGRTVREIGERLGISHVRVVKIKKTLRAKCAWLRGQAEGLPEA